MKNFRGQKYAYIYRLNTKIRSTMLWTIFSLGAPVRRRKEIRGKSPHKNAIGFDFVNVQRRESKLKMHLSSSLNVYITVALLQSWHYVRIQAISFLVAIVLNNLINLCQCSSALGYCSFLANNSVWGSLLEWYAYTEILRKYMWREIYRYYSVQFKTV